MLKVKVTSPATRCEICHQSDQFDPESNKCLRCLEISGSQSVELTTGTASVRRSVFLSKYFTWLDQSNRSDIIRNICIAAAGLILILSLALPIAMKVIGNISHSLATRSRTVPATAPPVPFQRVSEDAGKYFKEGLDYERNGNIIEATSSYKRCVELNPQYTTAHIRLAELYEKREIYPEAIVEYQLVIKQNPFYSAAYKKLAGIYRILGQNDKAEEIERSIPIKS